MRRKNNMAKDLESMSDEELSQFMEGVLTDPNANFDADDEDVSIDTDVDNKEDDLDEPVEGEDNDDDNDEDGEELPEQPEDEDADPESDDSDDNDEPVDTDDDEDDPEDDPEDDEAEDDLGDGEDADTDDEDEGQPADESATVKKVENAPETYSVKADGEQYDVSLDELLQLAPKAFNYTKKMQEMAPYKKMISAIKEQGLTQDDINLAIDILSGDKEAITSIIQKNKIDMLELDTDEKIEYTPKQYGKTDEEIAIDEVDSAISKDKEYKITQHVIGVQWDQASREVLKANPESINILHQNIKSGAFDKISPMATKLKALDGGKKSDIEYYVEAGDKYYADLDSQAAADKLVADQKAAKEAEAAKIAEAKTKREAQVKRQAKAKKRKAAAPTKRTAKKPDVVDYLDKETSDEEYTKMMEKLLSQKL